MIGSVEVGVTDSASEPLGGYTISLQITPQGGAVGDVSFTGATDVPGELIDSTAGPFFGDPNGFVFITDVTDSGGTVPLADEGLFNLSFLIDANTEGVFDVSFLFTPPGSELQDGAGLPVTTDFMDGSITVTVPEPGTAVILLCGAIMLLIRRRQASVTLHLKNPI